MCHAKNYPQKWEHFHKTNMNFDCVISTQTCGKSAINDMVKISVYIFSNYLDRKKEFS